MVEKHKTSTLTGDRNSGAEKTITMMDETYYLRNDNPCVVIEEALAMLNCANNMMKAGKSLTSAWSGCAWWMTHGCAALEAKDRVLERIQAGDDCRETFANDQTFGQSLALDEFLLTDGPLRELIVPATTT